MTDIRHIYIHFKDKHNLLKPARQPHQPDPQTFQEFHLTAEIIHQLTLPLQRFLYNDDIRLCKEAFHLHIQHVKLVFKLKPGPELNLDVGLTVSMCDI